MFWAILGILLIVLGLLLWFGYMVREWEQEERLYSDYFMDDEYRDYDERG